MKTHAQVKELLAHYDYLPPLERSEVDAHVATCAECAREFAVRPPSEMRAQPPPARQRANEPALRAPLPVPPPPPPILPAEPEPLDEPAPRHPFPWQRLLLPAGLVLLFIVSIWYGLRDTGRGPSPPVVTPQLRPTGPATATTIIFACDDVAAVYNDYAKIARSFEKENPDIKIQLKSYRDLFGNASLSYVQSMQEVAANADAFCVWDVQPLATVNLLYDLDPLVAADPSFEPPDFYDAVLNAGRYDGHLYAVPNRFQPALLRYDPKAFDDAGLAYPQLGWQWDDFAAAAKALTKRAGGNTQRWGFAEDAPVVFNARFRAALADPALASAASAGNPLAGESVVDLFRWYERVYVDDRAAPVPRNLEDPAGAYLPVYVDPRDIAAGKMAMWTDMMYQNARRQGKPAPFPVGGSGAGAPVSINHGWAIAAETLHAQDAWRLLNYLSRNPPPDSQLSLPARRSLVEKLPFWKALPAGEAEVYRYVLGHLAPRMDWPVSDDRVRALYRGLGGMVSSRVTLNELLAGASASSGASRPSPTNIPPITLAVPRDQVSYYRAATTAYMAATLKTNVQVIARESLSDPTRAEDASIWQQMRQLASRADVIAGPEVAALARSGRSEGILLDLTARLGALPPGSGFYSNTVESLTWRGRVWAVPDRVLVYMIAYYPGIFDQMNAAYPRPGWTWDDFARAAQAVTQPSADKMKWWGFSDGASGTFPLLLSATGPLVDYSVNPPKPRLDTSQIREAARWYAELWRQGYITVPDVRETTRDMAAPRQAAMWVELVDPASLGTPRQNAVSLAPFPVGAPSDATTPIEIENAFAISAGTDRPDDAWELIDFLLRYRAPDAGGPAGAPAQPGTPPSAQWANPDMLPAYEYALSHAQAAAPLRREEYFAREALVDAVTRLAIGERDVERVMRDAQATATARMEQ